MATEMSAPLPESESAGAEVMQRACGSFWSVCIACATSAGPPPRLSANPLKPCQTTD